MAVKYEIDRHGEGEPPFQSKAAHGGAVAPGEFRPTLAGAHAGIQAVKRAAAPAMIVEG